ncbi:hypothetical protein AOLI_G00052260 [Acnodon oligacanthus]
MDLENRRKDTEGYTFSKLNSVCYGVSRPVQELNLVSQWCRRSSRPRPGARFQSAAEKKTVKIDGHVNNKESFFAGSLVLLFNGAHDTSRNTYKLEHKTASCAEEPATRATMWQLAPGVNYCRYRNRV